MAKTLTLSLPIRLPDAMQAEALRIGQGQVVFLNDEEAAKATATNAGVLVRAWDLWKTKALAAR